MHRQALSTKEAGADLLCKHRSDAVIVGGNTVRRDNPRLTTRAEGGHTPARIVMSRTLELPEVCSFPLLRAAARCCGSRGCHGAWLV